VSEHDMTAWMGVYNGTRKRLMPYGTSLMKLQNRFTTTP
jgi:hypothetical protein